MYVFTPLESGHMARPPVKPCVCIILCIWRAMGHFEVSGGSGFLWPPGLSEFRARTRLPERGAQARLHIL